MVFGSGLIPLQSLVRLRTKSGSLAYLNFHLGELKLSGDFPRSDPNLQFLVFRGLKLRSMSLLLSLGNTLQVRGGRKTEGKLSGWAGDTWAN